MRVVWTRDLGDGTDFISLDDQLVLMVHDSEVGPEERVLLDRPASYAKPLITPDGAAVVFTIRHQGAVYAVDWDGSGLRRVADGFGLDVWADPEDGTTWVYVGGDELPTDPPSYPVVRRHRLDEPAVAEVVWDAQPVSGDSFQVSADGRTAAALLPWPTAGVIDLAAGTWRKLGEGCWTAFSPGADPLFWYFDGAHRNLTVVDVDTDERWGVPINDDPIFGGYEVYHPRWTNDPRALVLTGPYSVGRRANKIRGGGKQVEIHVGFFDETVTSVASWRRVTHNDAPDFYPDAWIEPGTGPSRRRRGPRRDRQARGGCGSGRLRRRVARRRGCSASGSRSHRPPRRRSLRTARGCSRSSTTWCRSWRERSTSRSSPSRTGSSAPARLVTGAERAGRGAASPGARALRRTSGAGREAPGPGDDRPDPAPVLRRRVGRPRAVTRSGSRGAFALAALAAGVACGPAAPDDPADGLPRESRASLAAGGRSEAGATTVPGRGDWLFFAPELRHASLGAFWGAQRRRGEPRAPRGRGRPAAGDARLRGEPRSGRRRSPGRAGAAQGRRLR